jgi:transposase-like protein
VVAWGLKLESQKVLLGPHLGSSESYESRLDFGRDLKWRGMQAQAPAMFRGNRAARGGDRRLTFSQKN